MTTLKVFEDRLVRVPYSHFHNNQPITEEAREEKILAVRKELSDKFGPNWSPIGPAWKDDDINYCVELNYQRVYEVPL